ncbi:MAG: GerMN domain-containing protein [Treponema sp.]|nr:GerMN domain-containing protein [Treponema sp.]
MKNNLIKKITLALLFLIILGLSLSLFFLKGQGKRYSFVFPSAENGKEVIEARYLKNIENKSDVNVYIDELLLGSQLERTKKLFTRGTKVLSCFQRDKTLYLDLSPELIYEGSDVIAIQDGIDLLKKNILMNFANISDIQVFVNGNYAFENLPKK